VARGRPAVSDSATLLTRKGGGILPPPFFFAVVRAFGIKEIPFNVVVGRDGTVRAVNEQGKRIEKAVRATVE